MLTALRICARPAREQTRGMATLNELNKRIKSTKNIRKITSSMKMVSAAKMRGDEARLKAGRLFGQSMLPVIKPAHLEQEEDAEEVEELAVKAGKKKLLVVGIASDRGLCGGVNSAVTRRIRHEVDRAKGRGDEVEIMVIGDKGRSQLTRFFPDEFTRVLDEAWKSPLTFATACALAERLCANDHTEIRLVHNVFKSAIAYDTVAVTLPKFASYDNMKTDDDMADGEEPFLNPLPHLDAYEQEPDDLETTVNLYEFTTASTLYGCLLDALAAEQAARMTAMDNASNNASDMINRLTLKYNRLRQAKITTELIEIISGAEALVSAD